MKTKLELLLSESLVALLILVGTVNASEVTNKADLESNLQREEWMMDETKWSPTSIYIAEFAEEMEEALVVEHWMTNADVWNSNFMIETESSLELEDWMTDDKVWENQVEVVEEELTVEDWMISDKFWR